MPSWFILPYFRHLVNYSGGETIAENQETKRKRWKGQNEYDKKTFKLYSFRLKYSEDTDIIEYIEHRKSKGEKPNAILLELARKGYENTKK